MECQNLGKGWFGLRAVGVHLHNVPHKPPITRFNDGSGTQARIAKGVIACPPAWAFGENWVRLIEKGQGVVCRVKPFEPQPEAGA